MFDRVLRRVREWVAQRGFLILLASELPILVHFGILIGVGIMTSFAASLTILPAIVLSLKPRFILGPAPGEGALSEEVDSA